MKPLALARVLAEPVLLGRGLAHWTPGHDALLAARLLAEADDAGLRFPEGTPRAPVAEALARTLAALRRASVPVAQLAALARGEGRSPDDAARLAALARLYAGYSELLEGRTADPVTILAAAREGLASARWLEGASVLIADDLELEPDEIELVAALAARFPVRVLRRELPAALRPSSFRARLASLGVQEVDWTETALAPVAPGAPPPALARLRERLFEPPDGEPLAGAGRPDHAVELVTAPGEAAEVRAIVRRLLREAARGVPFEEMGVVLPRPKTYAPLFTDLLERLGLPFRLHPSLPLRLGRAARSLLLLFRCRGLERPAVMEFLTFAPIPWTALLGEVEAEPARWDYLSRDAKIVSGYSRWLVGLRQRAELEREAAESDSDQDRRVRRERNAADADALLRAVEILNATLDSLAGEAPWSEWVARLQTVADQWIGPERDRETVLEVIAELGGLGSVATRAPWSQVEQVIHARFAWERLPLEPRDGGAIHIGALDAMAGLPFRIVAIPGLVEGGYPGVFRPDPFLLDAERLALRSIPDRDPRETGSDAGPRVALTPVELGARATSARRSSGRKPAQLALFAEPETGSSKVTHEGARTVTQGPAPLPTTQDRLVEARRLFHRAVSQATERLVLSYPRGDARSGRERLPSLFFAAAAATLAGRAVAGVELDRMLVEDDPLKLPLEDAVDKSERDRFRIRRDEAAATQIAAGSEFFKRSLLATKARWSGKLTRYDGFLGDEGARLADKLDPLNARFPISASRLATYSRCGFQYMLKHVLRLQAAPEPEERRRIEPLERGSLFHGVAEDFLRERREIGELPLAVTDQLRERLREMAEAALEGLVDGSPPRFTLLWEREKRRFHDTMQQWLTGEAASSSRSTPAYFELSFGMGTKREGVEPHDPEPLEIELADGRTLRVSGQIDRIDRRTGGGLVLRDYKTGKAPKDDGGVFRGGKQLQIPFYVLAVQKLFPGETVTDAFLDYVDGGRQVSFRPEHVTGPAFRALLSDLVALVARGVFVQEPSACDFCDFTMVCGPKGLIQRRQGYKLRDPSVLAYLRLRDVG
jgi:ATP-dependent helicase/nuclease subunit B